MISSTPPLPTSPETEEVADWAELVTIKTGSLTRGKLSTEVERNGGASTVVADAWVELVSRSELFGEAWSFSVSPTRLTLRRALSEELELPAFFAALGLRENIDASHRQLFEQCVSELVRGLLPSSLRLGHPRVQPVPSSLHEALTLLAQGIDELLLDRPRSTDKDIKLDVVAWRSFSDRRGGYLALVGQCATGADWESKLDELNVPVLSDHVRWSVPPVRFFATPHIVPVQHFRRHALRAGLLLDRPRLLELSRGISLNDETRRQVLRVLEDLY